MPGHRGTPPSGLLVNFSSFFFSESCVFVFVLLLLLSKRKMFLGALPPFLLRGVTIRQIRFVSLILFSLFLLAAAGCRACPMLPRPGHSFYLHIVLPFLFMHISALVYTWYHAPVPSRASMSWSARAAVADRPPRQASYYCRALQYS